MLSGGKVVLVAESCEAEKWGSYQVSPLDRGWCGVWRPSRAHDASLIQASDVHIHISISGDMNELLRTVYKCRCITREDIRGVGSRGSGDRYILSILKLLTRLTIVHSHVLAFNALCWAGWIRTSTSTCSRADNLSYISWGDDGFTWREFVIDDRDADVFSESTLINRKSRVREDILINRWSWIPQEVFV